VPAKLLASLAGKAQFLYLASPAARFFLREVRNVISTKTNWSAHVKLSKHTSSTGFKMVAYVPKTSNGRSMLRPVETTYLHVDSSGYGWGAVLNELKEGRVFWYDTAAGERFPRRLSVAIRH
jgi:hypothetical protein